MSEEIKLAEARGYSKGYAAGRRRKATDSSADRLSRERRAFIDRALIAILPTAMMVEGWSFGDKPIRSTEDRIELAVRWALGAEAARRY